MSFASQKNDMLLRNMIFRLNVEMIDSPKGEYDMFVCDERCTLLSPGCGGKRVPVAFPNVNGRGDLSTPLRYAQDDSIKVWDYSLRMAVISTKAEGRVERSSSLCTFGNVIGTTKEGYRGDGSAGIICTSQQKLDT